MEWKEVRLGDVCTKIGSGATPSGGKEAYQGGDYHLVRSQNVLDFSFSWDGLAEINDKQAEKLKNVELKSEDVLLNITGDSVARSCILPDSVLPARVNQHVAIIRADKEKLDYRFLLYTLQQQKNKLLSMASGGATRNALTKAMIEDFVINLPSLVDQKRIADILSSLDAKIENNNKINVKLEEMAQALFKSWFIDFEPFKDGTFVESELGMIPEGWKVGLFTEIMDIKPGGTPKTDKHEYWDNGNIPFFSPKDVTNSIYTFSTEKYITELGLNNCSSQLYPKNTVFITARGTVGKVAMAACNMAMNQSNYALIAKNGFSQEFLFFVTLQLVKILQKKSNGAVFSAITGRDFNEKIIIPSYESIDSFTEKIVPVFETIFTNTKENINLAQIRDTLLPKLMSGEIEL